MIDNNDIIIFSGPTLRHQEILQRINVITLPPAAQGDLLRAYNKYNPKHMAIIDGYYENRPAIWHKELLFLLSKGVHLYGASSMGALRASELDDFGMIGIGEVYRMYKSGILEDDDEVAVCHGPLELSYIMLSEAMVNIRVTLERAAHQNILSHNIKDQMIRKMKHTFYKERTKELIHKCYDELVDNSDISVHTWLKSNYINQKYLDAIELVEHLKTPENKMKPPLRVSFNFYTTSLFQNLLEST